MRVFDFSYFDMKTKIPFSEWPDIVHRFFEEFNLTNNEFFYYFSDFVDTSSRANYEKSLKIGPCIRALKDCPSLGEIGFINECEKGIPRNRYLSNIQIKTDCTEKDLLPLMNKIYRRYGFSDRNLYYYDVDFFGDVIPLERDTTAQFDYQLIGSGLHLHHDCLSDNFIELNVEVLHNGKILDATPYHEGLKKLLPQIKCKRGISVLFNEEEERQNDLLMKEARPLVNECINYINNEVKYNNVPETKDWGNDPEKFVNYMLFNTPKYSVAKTLKRLAKQYGYEYKFTGNYSYVIRKITERGHMLEIEVVTGPSNMHVDTEITFSGLGFDCSLFCMECEPSNQEELDDCADKLMRALPEFEKDLLPALDDHFPETPEWYNTIS